MEATGRASIPSDNHEGIKHQRLNTHHPLGHGNKIRAHGLAATRIPSGMNLALDGWDSRMSGSNFGKMQDSSEKSTSHRTEGCTNQRTTARIHHTTGIRST